MFSPLGCSIGSWTEQVVGPRLVTMEGAAISVILGLACNDQPYFWSQPRKLSWVEGKHAMISWNPGRPNIGGSKNGDRNNLEQEGGRKTSCIRGRSTQEEVTELWVTAQPRGEKEKKMAKIAGPTKK